MCKTLKRKTQSYNWTLSYLVTNLKEGTLDFYSSHVWKKWNSKHLEQAILIYFEKEWEDILLFWKENLYIWILTT